eukprot:6933582-Pyramimonas_sp.AAC.1
MRAQRLGDLGEHGIMATSATVVTRIIVAMLETVMTTTTARPVTAPMLLTPTVTASSRRR